MPAKPSLTVTHPDIAAQWHPTKNGDQTPSDVTPGSGKKIDSDPYYALIKRKIESEWIHPGFDSEVLEVIISITIGSDGKILSRKVEKTSGNMLFDKGERFRR